MNSFKFLSLFLLVAICVTDVICGPIVMPSSLFHNNRQFSRIRRANEDQQIVDVQKPIEQESITQSPEVKQEVKDYQQNQQYNQAPVIQEQIKGGSTDKQQDQPIRTNEVTEERITEKECSQDVAVENGGSCIKHKPDYSKAIAIAAKGNTVAAIATAGLAAPAVIKSAKVAALAGLIPVKLAAKGAIIGTLIAKPIIIKSALVGATAVKLSHLLVGKPIAIGANLLAGVEALKAKIKAKKLNKKGCGDGVSTVGSSGCETGNVVAAA